MDSEKNDETTESSSSESQETRPRAKVRDLTPEKDPMGAGVKVTAGTTEQAPPRSA
jgi:hypothetical protein